MQGMITEIERFSLKDGPGIRTTVFFNGCNMRCAWCHNPETLKLTPELMFYPQKCIGCGKCFTVCKTGAQVLGNNSVHQINRSRCKNCGSCAKSCYAGALVMCGQPMSVQEVLFQIKQDKAYYDQSNGGVTLSGGEVLLQREFAAELTDACHELGIQVAVESNISLPFSKIEPLFSKMDLIMCDLKIFNSAEHKKYTGVENAQILENIKKIDALNIPLIIRTPLIPGATDSLENIKSISQFLATIKNLKRYEMLNFNPLGASKYESLGTENTFRSALPLKEEQLAALKKVAEQSLPVVKVV